MKNIVDYFFTQLRNDKNLVYIKIVDNPKILARAIGIKHLIPWGIIQINRKLFDYYRLSPDELYFLLAHEVFHIDQNHLISSSGINKVLRNIIRELGKVEKIAKIFSIFFDTLDLWNYSRGILPRDALKIKQQELEADIWAIWVTNNKTAAISCLTKLVNYDLTQPSHSWESSDIELPIMTMGQRIMEIEVRASALENQGYKFK
ncbi:M48 family metalloprotease [Candidatus Borrarchaeum sp.]|uniref:M48 family metalloprotease n=1 Tax=Candidatus Borrarchaeum sp. TaxID=2846742 RepID=UPI00257C9A77|nr:M48 family metalloprotease [Candidatus Borrarchaeum sp.]